MEKNKKNEELQSRREFFKQAAKGALPVLGAILLANTPSILKAESTHVQEHAIVHVLAVVVDIVIQVAMVTLVNQLIGYVHLKSYPCILI